MYDLIKRGAGAMGLLSLIVLFIPVTSLCNTLTIDDFSDAPVKEFVVIPESDISTNLVNGILSRQFYSTNGLNKTSDQIVAILGRDPKSFQIKVGNNRFSVSCPAFFTNAFLTLSYDVNLSLTNMVDYFQITVPHVDHWTGTSLTITDINGDSSSQFNGSLGPVLKFYLTNFNNQVNISVITNLTVRVDFNTSSDFSLGSIEYHSEPKNNSCPVGVDDTYSSVIGSLLMGNVITNDYDPDDDYIYTVIETAPLYGRLYLTTSGAFSYRHYGFNYATDSFTYRLYDVDGCYDTVTVRLNIKENSCPVTVNDIIEVPIGGVAVTTIDQELSLLANDYDPDGGRLGIEIVEYPIYGTVYIKRDGSFIYTHTEGQHTVDSFVYRAIDPNGCSSLGTVLVTALPCGPCQGKVSNLELLYTGSTTARIDAYVKNGSMMYNILPSRLVQPNQIIVFNGEQNQDRRKGFKGTLGTELVISVNGVPLDPIHTSCSVPLNVGDVYGNFTVMSLKSKNNSFICE